MEHELKGKALEIRAWKKVRKKKGPKKGKVVRVSPWPGKFPIKFFDKKKKAQGIIIFNSQYMMDCEAMKGEVFQYDDCQVLSPKDFPDPSDLDIYGGADLAISEEDQKQNAKFALAIIGLDPRTASYFTLYKYEARISFHRQTEKILEAIERWGPIRLGIETNAYQKAQYQNVKRDHPESPLYKIQTDKDKMTRSWELAVPFEDGRWYFAQHHQSWIEHMVLFPGGATDDLFDATHFAYKASLSKTRRKRTEPGLI